MSLISRVVRSLTNGVSQQAPSVRLDNQLEEQVNMIPDVSSGLARRTPVALDDIIAHDGSRDYTEEHAMFNLTIDDEVVCIGIKPDGTVYRFDEGHEGIIIVQSNTVKNYLAHTDPSDLKVVETSDRFVIANRGVTVELDLTDFELPRVQWADGQGSQGSWTDWSSTMDAFMYVGVDGSIAGNDFNLFGDVVVIWNDTHTDFVEYGQSAAGNTKSSPANALYRFTTLTKGSSTRFTQADVDTTWRDSMPPFIDVQVSYEMGSDNVRMPSFYSTVSTSSMWLKIKKGVGSADSTAELRLGGLTNSSIAIDSTTWGAWNDNGDTFDWANWFYTQYDQDYYLGEEVSASSSEVIFGIKANLNKNQPSHISGLRIKWRESSGYAGRAWAVVPEGTTPYNTEKFECEYVGAEASLINATISCTSGTNIDSIEIKRVAYDDYDIDSINNPTQLPDSVRDDLSGLVIDISETERVIMGWCVYRDGADYEAYYSILTQSVDVGQERAYIYSTAMSGISGGSSIIGTYPSTIEANEVKFIEKETAFYFKYFRDDFKYTIPILGGLSVDIYGRKDRYVNHSTEKRTLIWVSGAFEHAVYTIKFDSGIGTPVVVATATGSTSSTPATIIAALKSQMDTYAPSNDNYIFNNTVITRGNALQQGLSVECSYGDHIHLLHEATGGNKATITDPSRLPARIATGIEDCVGTTSSRGLDDVYGETNFLVRVNPDINDSLNTYYLRYSSDYLGWVEDVIPFITPLDKTTLPVQIIKNSASDITISHTEGNKPTVGDNYSNRPPTILHKTINDIALFNGRLVYATDDTLVFSVINDIFNLYRTTTSGYLISDVVDLELDSSRLGYKPIRNIFNIDNTLTIDTGLSQSKLALPTNLDISSAIFTQASAFDLGTNVPLAVRRSMYFPLKQGSFSTIKVLAPDNTTGVGYTDNSATKHCERFIRGKVIQSLFSNDVFIVRTDDDPKSLYVQHTYVIDGSMVQNAWHKWTFKYDIKYIFAQGEIIKFIFEDISNSQTVYGNMTLTPQEIVEDTDTQIGYKPYLDFYTEDTTLSALLDDVVTVDKSIGKLVTSGDANSVDGIYYNSSFTLSEIVPRQETQQGQTKLGYTLLMLRRMAINMTFSGKFKAIISRTNRSDYIHSFVPSTIGTIVVGRDAVTNETARFPINGRSQDLTIKITTDNVFTPLRANSIEWQGQLITQGGR